MLAKINNKSYRLVKAKNAKLSRCYELRKNDILCEIYSTNRCRCYEVLTGPHKGIHVYSFIRLYPYTEHEAEYITLNDDVYDKLQRCARIIRLYNFIVLLLRIVYLVMALISFAVLIYSISISEVNRVQRFFICVITTIYIFVFSYMHIQVRDLYDKKLTVNL